MYMVLRSLELLGLGKVSPLSYVVPLWDCNWPLFAFNADSD